MITIIVDNTTLRMRTNVLPCFKTGYFISQSLCYTKDRNGLDTMEEKCKYSATRIAEYIVSFCSDAGILLSNIKLQKLLYFVFGWYYAETNSLLFAEPFEAWQHGPVVSSVYDVFCIYGGSYISPKQIEANMFENTINDKEKIDGTLRSYMRRDVFDLVDETHLPGSAWDITIKTHGGFDDHPRIEVQNILNEFLKKKRLREVGH